MSITLELTELSGAEVLVGTGSVLQLAVQESIGGVVQPVAGAEVTVLEQYAPAQFVVVETGVGTASLSDLLLIRADTEAARADAEASEATALAHKNAAAVSEANADASEAAALAHKNAAAISEVNAYASEAAALASKNAAALSESNADASEAAALASKNAAAASEAAALASKNAAAVSESNALAHKNAAALSETNADASEAAALASKNAAAASEAAALASKNAAAVSEAAALASKNAAALSETNADASEAAALASKNAAAISEANADASEAAALASKNAAAISETNAGGSATSALASKNAAATSETNALAHKNAAAASEANALSYKNSASTSEVNALSYKNAAGASATAAGNSAAAAALSETNAGVSETAAAASAAQAQQYATIVASALIFRGGWSAAGGVFPTPNLDPETSDYYRITVGGTMTGGQGTITVTAGDFLHWDMNLDQWFKVDAVDAVTSVSGRTGDVTLTKTDVGLANVQNVDQTNAANITSGTLAAARLPLSIDAATTGNAATATKLVAPKNINGIPFDGSVDITVADSTKIPTAGGNLDGALSYTPLTGQVLNFGSTPVIRRYGGGNSLSMGVGGDDTLYLGAGKSVATMAANIAPGAEDVHIGAETNIYLHVSNDNWATWGGRKTLQLSVAGGPLWDNNKIWHAGNDGAKSGLVADYADTHGDETVKTDRTVNGPGRGLFTYGHYNSGGPTAYGEVVSFGNGPGGQAEIAVSWSGNPNDIVMHCRSLRDTTDNWSGWKPVFTHRTVAGTNTADLVTGTMGDNDKFRIRIGGTAADSGWVEIATSDNGNEPIYVRQYTGDFVTVARTLTLLDAYGVTKVPVGVDCTNGYGDPASGTVGNGICGGNGDNCTPTMNNLKVAAWWGLGFGPSVSGQAVPYGEYSHWFNTRTGSAGMRGALSQNSDIRLKENVEVITDALAKTCSLRGIVYDRKDGGGRLTGVVAQEVQAVLPEAVAVAEDELQTLSVAYGNMVGLLIEAIKELKAEVDTLKTEVAALKAG